MINPLITQIKQRQFEIEKSLAVGSPINWESYQRMVGEYQGLQYAIDVINGLLDEERNKE
jgi:hypothetical protein